MNSSYNGWASVLVGNFIFIFIFCVDLVLERASPIINITVLKQSICQSQVTGHLNLTKSHRGHSKNHQKPQKMVQKGHIFLQIAIKTS